MPDVDDIALLREFVNNHSESAFATIVQRRVNLVYSVALRLTGNSEDAQDVTQAVFVILARKAAGLRPKTVLTGWLCETTRFAAMNFLTRNNRRQRREQEAYMQSTVNNAETVWPQLAPLLESAVSRLHEKDRTLLALRFYENRSMAETAAVLGVNESAARKRAERAMEKLRAYFSKRGVHSTADTIAGAISANSIQAAPAVLAKSVTTVALAKGAAASTSTLTLIKGALKIMAWTKAKTAVVVGIVVLLAATSTTIIGIKMAHARRPVAKPVSGLSPIAQTMTIDIRSGGTALIEGSIEVTNNTSKTVTSDKISGIDGAWRMTDDSGRPMKIRKQPGGVSVVELNQAVPPGGAISYKFEGKIPGFFKANSAGECDVNFTDSLGNLTGAHVVRTMQLPSGATLLEKDRGIIATTNADGRIELTLDKIVPANGTFPTQFRYRLPSDAN